MKDGNLRICCLEARKALNLEVSLMVPEEPRYLCLRFHADFIKKCPLGHPMPGYCPASKNSYLLCSLTKDEQSLVGLAFSSAQKVLPACHD